VAVEDRHLRALGEDGWNVAPLHVPWRQHRHGAVGKSDRRSQAGSESQRDENQLSSHGTLLRSAWRKGPMLLRRANGALWRISEVEGTVSPPGPLDRGSGPTAAASARSSRSEERVAAAGA